MNQETTGRTKNEFALTQEKLDSNEGAITSCGNSQNTFDFDFDFDLDSVNLLNFDIEDLGNCDIS